MSGIEERLDGLRRPPQEWSQPSVIDHDDADSINELIDSGKVQTVSDSLLTIEQDMRSGKILAPGEEVEPRTKWVYLPWSGSLIRYPDGDAHYSLRTSRNRPIVARSEQQVVRDARIAFIGLSVGSRVVDQMTESGTGNSYFLADHDVIDLTNLNRIQADMSGIDESKVSYIAKKTSQKDPYIDQTHSYDGYTPQTPEDLDRFNPSLILEHTDDLGVKVAVRHYAAERKVPVVMVTDLGEKSLVDVERYDIDPHAKPFHGALDKVLLDDLAQGCQLTDQEKQKATMKIVGGVRNIPPRLVQASLEMKQGSIGGIPQLGRTAAAGAVYADMVAQDILLGREVPSGRKVSDPRSILGLPRVDSRKSVAAIYWKFIRSQKKL